MERLEHYKFEDVHEFIGFYAQLLLEKGRVVKTTNNKNLGTLKEGLVEIPFQFIGFKNYQKILFNLPSFKCNPYWMVGEILSEMLALNPPIMARYSPTTIEESYNLLPSGHLEYTYGDAWRFSRQLDNIRNKLKENQNSKRCVLTTLQPQDMEPHRSDVSCTVNHMFLGREGKLSVTATMRSWDINRGTKYDIGLASYLQQVMASWTGMGIGELYFHVNSFHSYTRDFYKLEKIVDEASRYPSLSLELPTKMDIGETYDNLRRIEKAEMSAYTNNFKYFQYCLSEISHPIYRDFARIFGLKNFKKPHGNLEADYTIRKEWETEELKEWALGERYR